MRALTITNSQSGLHDPFVRDLASILSDQLALPVQLISNASWSEREARFDAGEIDMGWICGAPYIQKKARGIPLLPLAAPVMLHPRYHDRPIYFSDVVVRADTEFQTFDDLRGARWGYNEPHSHSGYHIVRAFLAERGWYRHFFKSVIASGDHQTSVAMILEGTLDASAIDSTVLEMLFTLDATIAPRLRIIQTLGPSPMPPLVIGAHIPSILRLRIQSILIQLDKTKQGAELLARTQMSRLTAVQDADYDTIRAMLVRGRRIEL